MAEASKERRQHPRAETHIVIDYATIDQFFTDYALNISIGGIFIGTEELIPEGTQLRIHFSVPDIDEFIETTGIVVHTEDGTGGKRKGMGIKFKDLSPGAKALIDELVMRDLGDTPAT